MASQHLFDTFARIRIQRAGTGRLEFVFSRFEVNRPRQDGDTDCTFDVTLVK